MLGNELAFVLKLKPGERKLLVSILLEFLSSLGELLSFEGTEDWFTERADWGEAAGDIISRKLIGLAGVRHSWSYGELNWRPSMKYVL